MTLLIRSHKQCNQVQPCDMCCKRKQTSECHYEDSDNNEYRSQNAVIQRLQREQQETSDQRARLDEDRKRLDDLLDAADEFVKHQSSGTDKTSSLMGPPASHGPRNLHTNFRSDLGCGGPLKAKPEINKPGHEVKFCDLLSSLAMLTHIVKTTCSGQ